MSEMSTCCTHCDFDLYTYRVFFQRTSGSIRKKDSVYGVFSFADEYGHSFNGHVYLFSTDAGCVPDIAAQAVFPVSISLRSGSVIEIKLSSVRDHVADPMPEYLTRIPSGFVIPAGPDTVCISLRFDDDSELNNCSVDDYGNARSLFL